MASSSGKENIADGLFTGVVFGKVTSLSPRKSSRKTRSKSIGPGGLELPEEPALKESSGNRRKSAFIPAVKSILASNDEDEKKRRRKSLARRRVSFAPEATLHTWDVVEYLRDATTSSASSEASRRASTASEAPENTSHTPDIASEDRPSTPPENVDEPEPELGSSPANQRDLHQKKHRRSSGIPPMNFNNPEDVYSSSPRSGEDASPTPGDDVESGSEDEETVKFVDSLQSHETDSMRLDEALRQATAHAGTHRRSVDEEEEGDGDGDSDSDVSMEIAEDEITAAFKPWARKSGGLTVEKESANPFSPAFSAGAEAAAPDEEEEDGDMSMDITRAIGGIVQPESPGSDMDMEDMSMDLTMPLGKIKSAQQEKQENRRRSLKRRASLSQTSQGSPAKRRTSLRQRASLGGDSAADDATMDFTIAIGGIRSAPPAKQQESPERRRSIASAADETMDFTVAIGSIKNVLDMNTEAQDSDSADEDMSMEFTNVLGGIKSLAGIKNLNKPSTSPEKSIAMHPSPSKSKTPTPKKSPAQPRLADQEVKYPDLSPLKTETSTPKKSPGRPRKSMDTTPIIPPPSEQIEKFEPSPFVRRTPQSAKQLPELTMTPTNKPQQYGTPTIPDDPVAATILNRRRSSLSEVHFSPLATAREEPTLTLKSTAKLSDSIRLLSTPRKQTLMSPMKRGLTPKKAQTPQKVATPKQKTPTPKKATPRRSMSPVKRVAFGPESPVQEEEPEVDDEPKEEVERISLQDFLDMTKIRFMDLSTTKRRHTAAPSSFHTQDVEEKEDSLDSYVVAAACTLPEYELYQHACHEMKKYISDGRHFVRTMEANVMEENPLLFTEYLTAPPDQRGVMDNQFKNLKTSARLDARGEWYTWRSTLLRDLKTGLLSTMEGFTRDEAVLAEREALLDAVLPPLIEKHGQLETQCKQLQQRHDELNSCDREELEEAREQLVATDAELEEKRKLVAQLQRELAEKEARIEAVKERKIECVAEIKAAERVREECRGWSTKEVNDLKAKVTALEQAHGWSITTASSKTITMTHLNDLELYFQPSAFATGKDTPNASISLAYVGDSATPHPRPLTTSKRFFLQLIRAHLHCIPQSQTRIATLLSLVKNSWATALSVAEGVRWLNHNFITDESILSDERLAISANMLLPSLQTKIRCTFEVSVSLGAEGGETHVEPSAELVYGEKYKTEKMKAFLKDFCGERVRGVGEMMVWADGVVDLGGRLRDRGRKGERA